MLNKFTGCYIKHSFKNPPVLSQRVERRDGEIQQMQLYYSAVFLGGASPEAVRTIEMIERENFCRIGTGFHFCLEMSLERRGRVVQMGMQDC